eukprot:3959771-Amphidinium_carterae.3
MKPGQPPPPPPPSASPSGPPQKAAKPPPSAPKTMIPEKGPPPTMRPPVKGTPLVTAYTSVPISTGSPPSPPPKPSASSSAGPSPPPPPAKPKPAPPPPPDVQAEMTETKATLICDLPWDNRNVSEEIKGRMVRYDPQWFREPHAMEVDNRQELLWRVASRERFSVRNGRFVEDYLSKVRYKNQREKDEVVNIALQLKNEYWYANQNRNLEILQEEVFGVVMQQYHIPPATRLSPRGKELPAEFLRTPKGGTV